MARREALQGRGRDVRYTWLEIRYQDGRFLIFGGSRWHEQRGRERCLKGCATASDAVTYANRRLRGMRRDGREIEDFTVMELHTYATQRGITWPDAPDVYIAEPAEMFFA